MRLSPELELLLCFARQYAGTETMPDRAAAALAREPDWDVVLASAVTHGLLPDACMQVLAGAGRPTPAHVFRSLEALKYEVAARNLHLAAELVTLLQVFEEAGARAVPLKGLVVAESLYGSIAARKTGDLDVLVCPEDLLQADGLLRGQGFRIPQPYPPLEEARARPDAYHVTYVRDLGSPEEVHLELHWRLLPERPNFPIDHALLNTEVVLERVVRMPFFGSSVWSLAPVDLLLFLCAHAAKHAWRRLYPLVDIARHVRTHPTLDWEDVFERARTARRMPFLEPSLLLTQAVLEAPLPGAVQERLASDPRLGRIRPLLRPERLFPLVRGGERIKPGTIAGLPPTLAFALRMADRPADRLRIAAEGIFVPTRADRQGFPLPRRLHFLYYLVRPLRLAGLLLAHGWSRLRGRGR